MAKVIDENYLMVKGVKQPINPPIDAKRGDYFKDSNGQIWIKQNYGGWTSNKKPGIGNDLTNAERAKDGGAFVVADKAIKDGGIRARFKPPEGPGTSSDAVTTQYPADKTIGPDSDYVLFQFKKYLAPFGNRKQLETYQRAGGTGFGNGNVFQGLWGDNREALRIGEKNLENLWNSTTDYNQSGQYEDAGEGWEPIVMYMPEDISTGFRGNWGGKAFSTVGAGLLGAAGQTGLDKKMTTGFGTLTDAAQRALGLQSAKALQKAVKAVGGDQLDNNDIFGSISGAIMNPNTELLFQAVDMRNFMLKFKLVPRNQADSDAINTILRRFKACTLPHRDPGQVMGFNDAGKDQNKGVVAGFIGVPNLCKVSFMRGAKESNILPRYKMLAVTQVDANYTPDGAYATYNDSEGQPVAIELGINFQETKINFAEEVLDNTIR
tara:strand:- start:674 stop:1978 length:1305 start_codon:yes stop_codon:yes gene_type:complete